QKDFALLLRAFAAGCGEGDRLVILGEGPERPRLERLAARLSIANRVELPGHVPDVLPWFDRADALVLSSRYEGAPPGVLEALARGLPVVATDCCAGVRDLLGGGAHGALVPPGDPNALARAMFAARAAPSSTAARREHLASFTIEAAAPRYLAAFAALVAAQRDVGRAPPAAAGALR